MAIGFTSRRIGRCIIKVIERIVWIVVERQIEFGWCVCDNEVRGILNVWHLANGTAAASCRGLRFRLYGSFVGGEWR